MIHETINLSEDGLVHVKTYVHEHYAPFFEKERKWQPDARPAVLILPGGAFRICTPKAGDPLAFAFLSAGFNVFVLTYSLGEKALYPAVLEDASNAMCLIRKNAGKWRIDPEKIAVMGFSAGGTLAAMLATQWNTPGLAERLGIPFGWNRPNALVVGYGLLARADSTTIVGKTDLTPGAIVEQRPPEVDAHRYVSKDTPPTFIWHTYEDEKVSYRNAMMFAKACGEHDIPLELHIFNHGKHGWNGATDLIAYGWEIPINLDHWVPMCINWLRHLFKF